MQINQLSTLRKSKTVLRTFRFNDSLDQLLMSEADFRGISENALVSMIMTKFVEWDRFSTPFHLVSLTSEVAKALLDAIDDDKLESLALKSGAEGLKEAMMFWFKEVSVENLVTLLRRRCKYGGQGDFEFKENQGYTLAIHHELGPKWSLFLKHYLDAGLRKIFQIRSEFETTDTTLIAKFRTHPSNQSSNLVEGRDIRSPLQII